MCVTARHLTVAIAVLGVTSTLTADSRFWTFPSSGLFSTGSNWSPTGAPGVADDAKFASTFGVTTCRLSSDATCARLEVSAGDVTLTRFSDVRTLTTPAVSVSGMAAVLHIEDVEMDADFFTVRNFGDVFISDAALVRYSFCRVGFNGGTPGLLRVEGAGTTFKPLPGQPLTRIDIGGNDSEGRLEVGDHAHVAAVKIDVGAVPDPDAEGELHVETGGLVSVDELLIGSGNGHRDAMVTLRHPGSRIDVADLLRLGGADSGFASMSLQLGAELDLGTFENVVGEDGWLDVLDGTVTIGGNTLDVDGGTFIAANASTITLDSGGAIETRNGGTIDWDRSVTGNSTDPLNPIRFEVQSGGLFEVAFSCTLGGVAGTSGELLVQGGRDPGDGTFEPSTFRGVGGGGGADLRVAVDGDGAVTILDGGFVRLRDDGVIAADPGSTGSVDVIGVDDASGTRSTLELTSGGNASTLIVGQSGAGAMAIHAGGLVQVGGDMRLASSNGASIGSVLVQGTGAGFPSSIEVGDDLLIATSGTGVMDVADAAEVIVNDLLRVGDGDDGTLLIRSQGRVVVGTTASIGTAGRLELEGGRLEASGSVGNSGTVAGSGAIAAPSVISLGVIEPGDASNAGIIEIEGNFTQDDTGALRIDCVGAGQYDVLRVTGNVNVDGVLEIIAAPGVINAGSVLDVIEFQGSPVDATFDTVTAPAGLTPTITVVGQVLRVTFADPCPTDLDGSGATDFVDLVAMLSSWGPCGGCPADVDGSGDVGFTDLVQLLSAFGPCD